MDLLNIKSGNHDYSPSFQFGVQIPPYHSTLYYLEEEAPEATDQLLRGFSSEVKYAKAIPALKQY
jgi:hypothetical protein